MKKYDYLIVGAGLFGATVGYYLKKNGKKVLIIDKRDHIAGNIYTKNENGIDIHVYGAHIFHTTEKEVWDFVNSLDHFIPYNHSVDANYKGEIYSLPFNMYTFEKVFGVKDPDEVVKIIEKEKAEAGITDPKNLEEKAISLVGKTIYELLVKSYTEKQWGRKCTELPPFIISRLPFRLTYDNNYFNDQYQGMPEHGYTRIIERLLEGIDVKLSVDYLKDKEYYDSLATDVIYTGQVDALFNYELGSSESPTSVDVNFKGVILEGAAVDKLAKKILEEEILQVSEDNNNGHLFLDSLTMPGDPGTEVLTTGILKDIYNPDNE